MNKKMKMNKIMTKLKFRPVRGGLPLHSKLSAPTSFIGNIQKKLTWTTILSLILIGLYTYLLKVSIHSLFDFNLVENIISWPSFIFSLHLPFTRLYFKEAIYYKLSSLKDDFQRSSIWGIPLVGPTDSLPSNIKSIIPTKMEVLPTHLNMTGKGMGSSEHTSGDRGKSSTSSTTFGAEDAAAAAAATKAYIKQMEDFMEEYASQNITMADRLKKAGEAKLYYEDKPEVQNAILALLQTHSSYLNKSFDARSTWINLNQNYLSREVKLKLDGLELKRLLIQNEYLRKVEKLSEARSIDASIKEFFTLTNAYRNSLNKELNIAEEEVHKTLRLTLAYKDPKVKRVVNSDLVTVKKIFNEQDSYLKKRIEEIIYPKKK